jgi:serine/threonine protein kinase/Tfp pilus assembly protein PilF
MEGRTLSHYHVLEQVGAGGMGIVYRARDERLERDVALKVLPPGSLSDEEARKRFRKEALTLSKLNNPNIATIYDFDSQEGVDFLVMEYIAGVTLSETLAGGPLPEKRIAELGAQIASALEEAHDRRVLHRDLKPGNIMVTSRGQAKVLDFGLAKLLPHAGGASQAETMSLAQGAEGTLPYMSPEQLREENVDARSDIYAAGTVLFEMATRRRPFTQESGPRLMDAILREEAPSPRSINARISPAMDAIIVKALDKDPNRRYQSARELRVDLERLGAPAMSPAARPRRRLSWWALAPAGVLIALIAAIAVSNVGGMRGRILGRSSPRRIESLAVLPLVNLSRDPEQEYFADGMTDELTASLSRISALRVISRTSAMHYKGRDEPVPKIASELHVDAIIEGSILKSGDRVRITAQLIDAASDKHLWAESYERDLRDVLAIQGEVAQAIADEVSLKISPAERRRLGSRQPVDPVAYDAYLKGRHFQDWTTEEGYKKSLEYFELAIRRSPDDALSYAALANSYMALAEIESLPYAEAIARAKPLALKALAIDDSLAAAHVALAGMLGDEWDWQGAVREFRRAIDLDPNDAQARCWYGTQLVTLGQFSEAHTQVELAAKLDPLSPAMVGPTGHPFLAERRYDQAIQKYRQALEIGPHEPVTHLFLGFAYVLNGMHEEAISEMQKTVDLANDPTFHVFLALAYAAAGRRDDAQRLLGDVIRHADKQRFQAEAVAEVYTALGDKDRAFVWLEKAYAAHSPTLPAILVYPFFDPLRSDPRFKDLMHRVGLAATN